MDKSYKGFRKPYVLYLATPADLGKTQTIVETLQENNIAVDYGHIPGKAETQRAIAVIAILSKEFYSDSKLMQSLFYAANKELEVIPVYMDEEELPSALAMLLYSVNSLRAGKYSSIEELAVRIISSKALQNPRVSAKQQKQFKIMSAVAVAVAVIIIAAATIIVSSAAAKRKEVMVSYGITEEELASMECVVFAGDERLDLSSTEDSIFHYVYDVWDDNNKDVFYLGETGEEIKEGSVSDLSILKKMPNLKRLVLINQPISKIPDLSEIQNIEYVEIYNCDISDLSFLKDSNVKGLTLRGIPATDLSPLSSMPCLTQFEIMAFEGNSLNFENSNITNLCICNSVRLRDISGLASCKNLVRFYINSNDSLSDISALKDIDTLEEIYLGTSPIKNVDALANKPKLRSLYLADIYFTNVNFLNNLGTDTLEYLHLYSWNMLNQPIDFSGIAAMKKIDTLSVSCNGYDYSIIGQYVTDISIKEYNIGHTTNIDFALFPKDVTTLGLTGYKGTQLPEIPDSMSFETLLLCDSPNLSSLNGIGKISGLKNISFTEMIRLKNFDSLYKLSEPLDRIVFQNGYVADISRIKMSDGCKIEILDPIENYEGLSAIGEIKTADGSPLKQIDHLYINGVSDVRGLYSLAEKDLQIAELAVDTPLLGVAEEYANKLAERTGFVTLVRFERFSNSVWSPDDFKLLSYEEISSLPSAALKAVNSVSLVGDLSKTAYSYEWRAWVDDNGESSNISVSGQIDMKELCKLENLEYLKICNCRIENFEYIQTLQNLKNIELHEVNAKGLGILDVMSGLESKTINDCSELE